MDFSNMTNLRELFAAGGPILLLLILLSLYSWAVILERFFKFRNNIGMSRKLIAYCRHPIRSDNYEKVVDGCTKRLTKKPGSPERSRSFCFCLCLGPRSATIKGSAAHFVVFHAAAPGGYHAATTQTTLFRPHPHHRFADPAGPRALAGGGAVHPAGHRPRRRKATCPPPSSVRPARASAP